MSRATDLDAYLADVRERAFDWAEWNCCHFVAGWVLRLTGTNVMQGQPRTGSRHAAHRLIGQLGGSLDAVWTLWLRTQPMLPAQAQLGDVVSVVEQVDEHTLTEAVGLCCGRTVAALTETGVAYFPIRCAERAWRLECVQ